MSQESSHSFSLGIRLFLLQRIAEIGGKHNKMEKQHTMLGIDTIEVVIDTPFEIIENNVVFKSNTGIKIGELKHKQGKTHGYRLNINLPKCIRTNNIEPFGVVDACKLYEVTQTITEQLKEHFGDYLPELQVRTAEVNATIVLRHKENVQPMLNMITGMLLQDKTNVAHLTVRGKQTGERYKKVETLTSGMNVESLKLPQNSTGRFSQKIYDKGLQQGIQDEKGIIRIEHILNRSGLDFAKAGRSLDDFLTVESIQSLLKCFKSDFKKYFCDRFWNNTDSTPYYEQCIQMILSDLKTYKPLTTALMNRTIIEQDFSFFIKACKLHYDNPESARKAIYRVRKSGEIEIHENVADDFVRLCRGVIYG